VYIALVPRYIIYGIIEQTSIQDGIKINNREILSTIGAINESLSIANSPKLVLEMTLETLSHTLEIECSWIQLMSSGKSDLELAAHYGFNFMERLENIISDVDDAYQREIIGLGNSLIIPNLQRNNPYDTSTLNRMGYQWLVAVPMRNHRLAGVMSLASRKKRKINDDFGEFMEAIAGLAIMTYEKISEKLVEPEEYETPLHSSRDESLIELTPDELFSLDSEPDVQDTQSSSHDTDLLDEIYSRKEVDQIAARFNSDVETVRNDIESIRNKLIESYQTRRFTETAKKNDVRESLVDQKSPLPEYVTREEFNEFKQALKTFLANTLDLLDDF